MSLNKKFRAYFLFLSFIFSSYLVLLPFLGKVGAEEFMDPEDNSVTIVQEESTEIYSADSTVDNGTTSDTETASEPETTTSTDTVSTADLTSNPELSTATDPSGDPMVNNYTTYTFYSENNHHNGINCAVCHTTHASQSPDLLTEPRAEDLCLSCHGSNSPLQIRIGTDCESRGNCGQCHKLHGDTYTLNSDTTQ